MDDPNHEILQSRKVNELKLLATDWRDVHNIYMLLCLATQLGLTLCDPIDCGLPGSSVHGHAPGKNTEWAAMPSSRGSSKPRDRSQVSHFAG